LPALRSKQKLGVAAGTLSKSPPRRTSLADGSADPGEVSQESTLFAGKQRRARNYAKPTLSQTWTADKPASAICVQSVDAHMSCSSHSDAQLAAFFIDPRAKWSTVQCCHFRQKPLSRQARASRQLYDWDVLSFTGKSKRVFSTEFESRRALARPTRRRRRPRRPRHQLSPSTVRADEPASQTFAQRARG